jgi:hypothetical protein
MKGAEENGANLHDIGSASDSLDTVPKQATKEEINWIS